MEAINTMAEIYYKRSLDSVTTEGLLPSGEEIRVKINTADLFPDGEEFLRFVVNYVRESGRRIHPEETLAYGYWLVKFRSADDSVLEVWEYNAEATDFVAGAHLALTYWRDQHRVCNRAGALFTPPRPDRLTVIDEGVLEGLPVQGVRYPSPEHMSGWWITTDRYNGDVNTLRREHTYHITAARPDLAKYLALPFGFRFDLESHEDIWCDEGVSGIGSHEDGRQ